MHKQVTWQGQKAAYMYHYGMIIVSIKEQVLYHRRRTGVWLSFAISTSAFGTGNEKNSFKTPLGKHRICAKIGDDMPVYTAFHGREPVGTFDPESDYLDRDWILSRILWLDGCEPGKNKGGRMDSKHRYIYIHGTHEEDKLGTPASHGCIRMSNLDILDMFEHAFVGERVLIRP